MKLLAALLFTYSSLTFASVDPQTFTGKFTVGTCTMSPAKKAEIELTNNTLIIKFENDEGPHTSLKLEDYSDEIIGMKVSTESFTLTNEFYAKMEEGKTQPIMTTKIARSATGNRVRLSVVTFEDNSKAECVLYRK
jgi:hypothetical protein